MKLSAAIHYTQVTVRLRQAKVSEIRATQARQPFRSTRGKRGCHRRGPRALQVVARNRILLRPSEIENKGSIQFPSSDGRAKHILQVLKLKPGDQVKVGIMNGAMGQARVAQISPALILECQDWVEPSPRVQVYLLLAMPRPKAMKRLWSTLACLGVTRVYITGAEKMEKVYFGSHALEPSTFIKELIIGAEQAGDTRLPAVFFSKSLKATLASMGLAGGLDGPTSHRVSADQVQTLLAEGATEYHVNQSNLSPSAMQQEDNTMLWESTGETNPEVAAVHDSGGDGKQQASLMPIVAAEKSNAQEAAVAIAGGGRRSYAECGIDNAVKLLAHTAGGTSVRQAVLDHLSQCTPTASPTCVSMDTDAQNSALPAPMTEVSAAADAGVSLDKSSKDRPVVILAVGPEGGWTASEVALFTEELGFQTVTTAGGRTLDTTTAIISLVSIVGEAMMDCSSHEI